MQTILYPAILKIVMSGFRNAQTIKYILRAMPSRVGHKRDKSIVLKFTTF